MKTRKHLLPVVMAILCCFATRLQAQTVSGIVLDLQNRQPVKGMNVMTADSSNFTVTDGDGHFRIQTHNDIGTLLVFGSGYKTQRVRYRQADEPLHIQLMPDIRSLNEVKVTAFSENKSIKETAGSIALLSGKQLRQGDGTSMQEAFNSVPGVRMDHSYGEDSRISIRGEGVRAPWGNRNIKIYINDIPLTETDGTSRIEALDLSGLGQAEIIKGPASSLYGGGVGGVIRFRMARSPYQERSIEAAAMAGEYGLNRQALTYRNGSDKFNSFITIGRQSIDGFREHSRDEREFIAGNFQWFPSTRRSLTLLVSRSIQNAQIPGALTAGQVKEDRRQANTNYLDKKSGRLEKWTRIGVGQKYDFNNHFSNTSSVFTYFYDLDHPLPFGIIHSAYQSFGGRTRFDYNPGFTTLPTHFTVGAEFTQAFTLGSIYNNNHGTEDGIFSNTSYKNRAYSVFYQSETSLGKIVDVVLGLSINGLTYNGSDLLHSERSGIKKFQAQLAPRVAISHNFGRALSLHGSISSGFTNPSSDQVQNPDRSVNQNIQAEKGINYEIDAKGNFFRSRLSYDLSLFLMNMSGELIGQSLPMGVTVYHNSGKTQHQGVELALSYQILKEEDSRFVRNFRPYLGITYAHFRFKDYKKLGENNEVLASYDGNQLTGIAPWMVSAGLDLDTKIGLYAHASLFYNDRYALNDANTDFNPAYTVVNVKLGYQKRLSKHFGINIYAGLQNLTNTKYSSLADINAPDNGAGAAYFNPSMPRNGYAGLNFKYYLTK